MARRATVAKLLEGGPFRCKLVNPDADVEVLSISEAGVKVQTEAFGRQFVTLVKVGGLRCTLPPKPPSPATVWVKQQLAQRDMTYDDLYEAATPRIKTSVASVLAHLSRENDLVAVGSEKKKKGRRWRTYRVWSLAKKEKP